MLKKIFLVVFLIAAHSIAEASVYVVISKDDGSVIGTVDVTAKHLQDWEKDYRMVVAGEEFRGKHADEIKIDNNNPKLCTSAEVSAKRDEARIDMRKAEKGHILGVLGITEGELSSIKNK